VQRGDLTIELIDAFSVWISKISSHTRLNCGGTDILMCRNLIKTFSGRLGLARVFALTLLLGSDSALAQHYPSRAITAIVPFAGGSASDVVSRAVTLSSGVGPVRSRSIRRSTSRSAMIPRQIWR